MFSSHIQGGEGYDADDYTYYPIVIIGAGESGIAMACQLKDSLGFDQFRVLERQSGIGGTWWINRYPGVACDVPAVFYSYSFCQNPTWTTFFPSGQEILQYLQGVAEKYQIIDKVQLNTDVISCQWNTSEGIWQLDLQHMMPGMGDLSATDRLKKVTEDGSSSVYIRHEKIQCKILISAVGGLVQPKEFPADIPGRELFQGKIFHSARWDHNVDLENKDVVVVGTGCSAAQFVPELLDSYGVKSVTQLMRSPPWVVPRPEPPFGTDWWKIWGPWLGLNIPCFGSISRKLVAMRIELDFRLFGVSKYSENERTKLSWKLLKHMKKAVPAKYHDILTPDYGVGCKRRIYDTTWFSSLHNPRMQHTTLSLTGLQENAVSLTSTRVTHKSEISDGRSQNAVIPADVIILANGFQVTQWLHPIEIIGSEGKSLHSVFEERGGPQMYMGTAMDRFPNFFVLFGPNTVSGHSSVILCSENQVAYCLKFIKPILEGVVSQVEIKNKAELAYTADIQSALKKTVWNVGGCASWYKSSTGWNSASYPYSQIWFTLRCMFPTWNDWDITYTRAGLRKRRIKAIVKIFTVAAAILAWIGIIMGWHPLKCRIKISRYFKRILDRYWT